MKKKELIVVNCFILALLALGGVMTFNLSINKSIANTGTTHVDKSEEQTSKCSNKQPLAISSTDDPYLQALANYQKACDSFVTNTLMVFTGFSGDEATADENAKDISQKLKKFHQAGVTPIVIAEPYVGADLMSYKAYLQGDYDAGMEHFFQQLKALGVTDEMMGTWVPFPESNTPSWNNKDTEPKDFALCVNKYLGKMKQYFPQAKGSVLLNATTYLPTDSGWENGDYISLAEYVDQLDKNLVTSFGIQGFPWVSNAQQTKRTIFKASEFLQPDLAIGAAQILRTRDIWINSGTFASKYTNDPSKTVHLSLNERKAILEDILTTAENIRDYQQNEYRVSINLFSENKSSTTEATDWSYLQDVDSTTVLKDFLAQADEAGMPVSLYDKVK